jgi:hypothetical protein
MPRGKTKARDKGGGPADVPDPSAHRDEGGDPADAPEPSAHHDVVRCNTSRAKG